MATYTIRPSGSGGPATRAPKSKPAASWKCPYCQGKGLNPYGKSSNDRCPACHGHMTWEADVVIDTLSSCGRCAGAGRINYMGNWDICPNCKGAGKV